MIELLIGRRLSVVAEGGLRLPKQPPFVPDDKPAALIDVEFGHFAPKRLLDLFDDWYRKLRPLEVLADDGAGTCVFGGFACVDVVIHRGIQSLFSRTPAPRWRMTERGLLPYQPTPTHQRIAKDVFRYVLATDAYQLVGKEFFLRAIEDRDHQRRAAVRIA